MVNLRFVTVSGLRQRATQIVAEVESTGTQIIITKNGRPVVVLQRITEEELSLTQDFKNVIKREKWPAIKEKEKKK
jgi:prevent-host-death family protein